MSKRRKISTQKIFIASLLTSSSLGLHHHDVSHLRGQDYNLIRHHPNGYGRRSMVCNNISLRDCMINCMRGGAKHDIDNDDNDRDEITENEPTNSSTSQPSSSSSSSKHPQHYSLLSVHSIQGKRAYMEDELYTSKDGSFAAIFDGHGGAAVSRYLRQNLYARYLQAKATISISDFNGRNHNVAAESEHDNDNNQQDENEHEIHNDNHKVEEEEEEEEIPTKGRKENRQVLVNDTKQMLNTKLAEKSSSISFSSSPSSSSSSSSSSSWPQLRVQFSKINGQSKYSAIQPPKDGNFINNQLQNNPLRLEIIITARTTLKTKHPRHHRHQLLKHL